MTTRPPKAADVAVGDALPELEIPLTVSLIIGGALASRDFTPVHHDRAKAQAAGMSDVFMNILTTNGLIGRFVTDWAGPEARLLGMKVKLGTPNLPGDTLKLSGRVSAKQGDHLTLEVVGKNSWGNHATATVRVELPA